MQPSSNFVGEGFDFGNRNLLPPRTTKPAQKMTVSPFQLSCRLIRFIRATVGRPYRCGGTRLRAYGQINRQKIHTRCSHRIISRQRIPRAAQPLELDICSKGVTIPSALYSRRPPKNKRELVQWALGSRGFSRGLSLECAFLFLFYTSKKENTECREKSLLETALFAQISRHPTGASTGDFTVTCMRKR